MELKSYRDPVEYPELFKHNYDQIAKLGDLAAIRSLVAQLAYVSNLSEDIILLEIKRYLITNLESQPIAIRPILLNRLWPLYYLIKAVRSLISPDLNTRSQILFDDWASGVQDNFYGPELLRMVTAAHSTKLLNLTKYSKIRLFDYLSTFPSYIGALRATRRVEKELGISLYRLICRFYVDLQTGRYIRNMLKPMLIISGNDNGFPVAKARFIGCPVLLIQNGSRAYLGDSCFKYAEYHIAMGTGKVIETRLETGNVFGKIYPLGSLRLANYSRHQQRAKVAIKYDYLWVSGWNLIKEGNFEKSYYSSKMERRAVELLKRFAEKQQYRIAYHCRYPNELDDLRKLGLFSDRITYFEWGSQPVYSLVNMSEVVLSSGSTVTLEAMSLGKKIGLINLSGNSLINETYRPLALEYCDYSGNGYADFLRKIISVKASDYINYIVQSANYHGELERIIDGIIK